MFDVKLYLIILIIIFHAYYDEFIRRKSNLTTLRKSGGLEGLDCAGPAEAPSTCSDYVIIFNTTHRVKTVLL